MTIKKMLCKKCNTGINVQVWGLGKELCGCGDIGVDWNKCKLLGEYSHIDFSHCSDFEKELEASRRYQEGLLLIYRQYLDRLITREQYNVQVKKYKEKF